VGLFCKVKLDNVEAYDDGYENGVEDTWRAVDYLEKRMEGKY